MFLLLLRHVPRAGAWLAKKAAIQLYRNLNVQSLILAPLVLLLLLLPAYFSAEQNAPRGEAQARENPAGYTSVGYPPTNNEWSLDR